MYNITLSFPSASFHLLHMVAYLSQACNVALLVQDFLVLCTVASSACQGHHAQHTLVSGNGKPVNQE